MRIERRQFLALSAAAPVAAVTSRTPALAAQAENGSKGASQALAEHAANLTFAGLPARTVAVTKLSLLDAIGVSAAASGLEPICRPFPDIAAAQGTGPCTVFGSRVRAPAASASWANGALAHALDYEDVHDASGMHPNAAVVPAALALCESLPGISGEKLITAIAVGCDIACRLGLARTQNLNKYGWYFPPIASAFGATATAGHLYGLDPRQMLDAFSLTLCETSCSSELVNNGDTHIRAIRDAFPARTAITSAMLAKAGVRGFDAPFEGAAGFATMYARGDYDFARLLDSLGERFLGEEISFKAWPACRGSHPYIQAALALRDVVPAEKIDRIVVTVRPLDEMLCVPPERKSAPATSIDAKFSIPFTVATAFVHGDVTLRSFDDAARADPRVRALARRCTHRVAPKGIDTGDVTLELFDILGQRHVYRDTDLLGSTGNPLSQGQLLAKFTDCMSRAAPTAGLARAPALGRRILSLETMGETRRLLRA